MDLSVIIPVYKEANGISATLEALAGLAIPLSHELIVVDGEPAQTTIRFLQNRADRFPGLRLLSSTGGRGPQMNAGARAAQGQLLLFLHADTRLSRAGMHALAERWEARTSGIFCGAFDLAIDDPAPWFRIIERTASFRSRCFRMPYGDQAIFISKILFERVGGFPAVPLMEDVGLMQQLRRQRIRPLFLRPPALTSARRWHSNGVFRTTLRNWILILRYLGGAAPEQLARIYYPGRFDC